jgi:putative membrane protein
MATLAGNAVRGFLMGAADIVPGVSGGTVALVLGIYERLVASVRRAASAAGRLLGGRPAQARQDLVAVEWSLVVPLLVGVLVAIGALSALIDHLLEDEAEVMAGLFLGLVAASVAIASRMVRRWTAVEAGTAFVVGVGTFALLGLQNGPVADPTVAQFAGAGAVAICAMILPGISGSFLLLMLGMYAPVLDAVNERALADLVVFAAGAAVGLSLFSTVLGRALERWRDPLLAALVGLMAGSLRVLWPWPNGVGIIAEDAADVIDGTGLDWPAAADLPGPTIAAIAGFLGVIAGTAMAGRTEEES